MQLHHAERLECDKETTWLCVVVATQQAKLKESLLIVAGEFDLLALSLSLVKICHSLGQTVPGFEPTAEDSDGNN